MNGRSVVRSQMEPPIRELSKDLSTHARHGDRRADRPADSEFRERMLFVLAARREAPAQLVSVTKHGVA